MTYIKFDKNLFAEEKIKIYELFIKTINEDPYLLSEWQKILILRKIHTNTLRSNNWETVISMNFILIYDDQDKRIDVTPKIQEGDIVKIYEYDSIINDIENSELIKINFWSFLEKLRNINNKNSI